MERHHQGDIGMASFAAVPELVRIHETRRIADWNFYALVATIEEARENPGNPQLPEWLCNEYEIAWRDLERLALSDFHAATDDSLVHSLIAVLALCKGRRTMARMAMLTEDERLEMLGDAGWG
jgi:phytoene/squalene synthetase